MRLAGNEKAAVSVIGALAMTSVIGFTALAVELGQGYSARVDNQRVADVAALGAALAYAQNSAVDLTSAARRVAQANGVVNGVGGASVTVQPDDAASPSKVTVTVRTMVPVHLARVLGQSGSYGVTGRAVAALPVKSTPACVVALGDSGNGIELSGATVLNAGNCGINTNANVSVSGSSSITTESMRIGGSMATSGASSINVTGNGGAKTGLCNGKTSPCTVAAGNPLPATDSRLIAAFAKLGQVPTLSVPQGTDFNPAYYPTTYSHSGKIGTLSGSTWTFPAGTYAIRNMTIGGGLSVIFKSPSVITVSGNLNMTGAALKIGENGLADLTVAGSTSTNGSSTTIIGRGTHYFGGPITIGGGANFIVDAGPFSVNGNLVAGGQSNLWLGATDNHLINGNLEIGGYATLGAGTYTINGDFLIKSGCWSCLVSGTDVTFIMKGRYQSDGGTLVSFSAPSAGPIPDLLMASLTSSQMAVAAGSQVSFSGMIWAPNAEFLLSGGASINGKGSACFMVVANKVSIIGGTTATSICPAYTDAPVDGDVTLVQ